MGSAPKYIPWYKLDVGAFVMALLIAMTPVSAVQVQAQARMSVTDVRGRKVQVPVPAKRILIDDGRFLVALSLIQRDPSASVAAWPHDTARIGVELWGELRSGFPSLASLPVVPSSAAPFSVERVLSVRPDVAVFSLGRGPTDAEIGQLQRAGVPVVFIDFFQKPLTNMEPSLRLLGTLTGSALKASEFIEFRRSHLEHIRGVLAANKSVPRPKVLLEAHAGSSPECCFAPGRGNIGDYLSLAGGVNIGASVIPGASGRINPEYIIAQNPEVYVATGGPHLAAVGGVVVGPEFTPDETRAALRRMISRPGFGRLRAVRSNRVHALSHQLLNSPLDILAVEALAVWLHPDLFADLDPAKTLKELNQRFLAIPLSGPWWVNLQ